MHDQGVHWSADRPRRLLRQLRLRARLDASPSSCSQRVALPLLPGWLCGRRCLAGITVSAHHSERISCYSGTGAPGSGSRRC